MRFKVDENLSQAIAEILRSLSQVADTVSEEGLSGSPDALIVETALREDRIIVGWTRGSLPSFDSPLKAMRESFYYGLDRWIKQQGRRSFVQPLRRSWPCNYVDESRSLLPMALECIERRGPSYFPA